MTREKLLEVKNLKTYFSIGDKIAKAVDGVDFEIFKGEILGIVGESGSGKSVTVLSLIQLIPNPPGEVVDGQIIFNGEKIFDGEELQKIKAIPEFKFFHGLSMGKRHIIALFFLLGWMFVHSLLPIPGFLPFLASLVIAFAILYVVLYTSPRRKPLRQFRQNLYKRIRELRGAEIAMIFQEPMTSLNPVFTVGMQIVESLYQKSSFDFLRDWVMHTKENFLRSSIRVKTIACLVSGTLILLFSQLLLGWTFKLLAVLIGAIGGALLPLLAGLFVVLLDFLIPANYREKSAKLFKEGVKLLEAVGIPDPELRMYDYPHQFSGGMRQRAMIAMALARNPSLLIADEPTTALDVTIQAQILDLMVELKKKRQEAAIVLITHDLAVVAETCERVIVMYGGKIQEVANTLDLFDHPKHPYTRGLINSIPKPEQEKRARLEAIRGMVPNILSFPPGCKFCSRCDYELDICSSQEPDLTEIEPGHMVRCHLYDPKYADELKKFKADAREDQWQGGDVSDQIKEATKMTAEK